MNDGTSRGEIANQPTMSPATKILNSQFEKSIDPNNVFTIIILSKYSRSNFNECYISGINGNSW